MLADYRNVPDPELVARRGLFVAEGRLVVRRLLASDRFVVRSALLTETAFADVRGAIEARPGLPVYLVTQDIMNAITGFNIHRGCLALAERPPAGDWRELAASSRTLLVLERVGNADNVGSLFRNAAALGADAVLLGPACADPLYRKAIRTSMGAVLTMPFADLGDWPAALHELRAGGWSTIALTPDASAAPAAALGAIARERRCAILVGHEGEGLTAAALAAGEHRIRIPMAPHADSLNVATAAAIALYELGRGRR